MTVYTPPLSDSELEKHIQTVRESKKLWRWRAHPNRKLREYGGYIYNFDEQDNFRGYLCTVSAAEFFGIDRRVAIKAETLAEAKQRAKVGDYDEIVDEQGGGELEEFQWIKAIAPIEEGDE
jgi:hypothetical protein